MNFHHSTYYTEAKFTLRNHLSDIGQDQVARTILCGLTCGRKHISSMFFYDAIGSKLFEEITRLPEYYPTRTEKRLLHQAAPGLFDGLTRHSIVEIGSGDCSKISILLGAIPQQRRQAIRYIPVDVSEGAIQESAGQLQRRFPGLEIHGIVADFTRQLHLIPQGRKRYFCFLGSTIGNLSRGQARQFLCDLSRIMLPGDALLLGVDMIKSVDILERAYNDSSGITAAFNRNILNVANRLVGTDFDPLDFAHLAFYDRRKNRIEMHLQAVRDVQISCPAVPCGIRMRKGETIHTENSHKYADVHIGDLAATAGLKIKKRVTDEDRWFSLIKLSKE